MRNKLIHFILAALLIQSPTVWSASASGGACEQAVKKANEKCPEKMQGLATGAAMGGTINGGADQMKGESAAASAHANNIKATCQQASDECKKSCKTEEEQKKCEPFGNRASMAGQEAAQADQAGQQAGQTGDSSGSQEGGGQGGEGGGMNPGMAAGLLGAAGGLLAAMMGKKKDDKPQQQMPQLPLGALQANMTVDCNQSDAGKYSECNDQLAQKCMTALSTPACQAFASRYCGGASGTPTTNTQIAQTPAVNNGLGDGIKTSASADEMTAAGRPNLFGGQLGANGEGLGTPFCKFVVATNYCSQSGRDKCPSCVQLAINKSPICMNDPGLCLAQNSPDQINQAKQTCPTDPAFSDPTFVAGGSQLPPNLRGGPPAVLPQQDGLNRTANTAGSGSGTNTMSGAGGGGISTSSLKPSSAGYKGASGEGVAEGNFRGGSAGNSGGGGGSSYRISSAGGDDRVGGVGGGRETASTGGYRPASAGGAGGPAPDVQGQYGPSLFALGSQPIRNRCAAGKLLNCP